MPSALEYIEPTKPVERKAFEQELQNEKRAIRSRYHTALRYYMGQQDSPVTLEEEDAPDDSTYINMVKMTVDRTKAFLFPAVPAVELDPKSVEETDEEKWVQNFIKANGGLPALHRMALRGCLAGHVYVRMVPVAKELQGDEDFYPTMILLEPTTITTYWRGDDIADVIWYEYRYVKNNKLYIEDTVKIDHGRAWAVYTYEAKTISKIDQGTPTHHGKASLVSETPDWSEMTTYKLISTVPHSYRIPPIISWAHLPNPDDFYGQNEVTQKHLQDSINRVASERSRIVRENSDPVDVLTGHDGDDLERKGGLVAVPSAQARITRLEMKGDLDGINTTLQSLIETYLAVAMVVLLKGEAKDLQRVTNASVRTLFLDMLSKNRLLQAAYGDGLEKIIRLGLMMGIAHGTVKKGAGEVAKDIKIDFGSALPIDLMEIAQINQIMVTLGGRSLQTAATAMGDDWAQEQAQMEAELELQVEKQQKMMEAFPDQTVGPDGKPTGAPSPDKQHEQNIEMEKTKAASKPKPKPGAK
jgi:hypothetical protein